MAGRPLAHAAATLALSMLLAGCASTQSGNPGDNRSDCPMGFTMSCDATRQGSSVRYSHCQCVRHRDIDEFLLQR